MSTFCDVPFVFPGLFPGVFSPPLILSGVPKLFILVSASEESVGRHIAALTSFSFQIVVLSLPFLSSGSGSLGLVGGFGLRWFLRPGRPGA